VEIVLAFVAGSLVAASVYLLLSRNLIRVVFGLILMSNAANLVIFTAGRLTRGIPPLLAPDDPVPPEVYANPLPQALILTAIVISFSLLAFTFVLVYRAYQELHTLDSDRMRVAEPITGGGVPMPDKDALAPAGLRPKEAPEQPGAEKPR
jgi:multicomponent Na+:H+ antiporter subunit C